MIGYCRFLTVLKIPRIVTSRAFYALRRLNSTLQSMRERLTETHRERDANARWRDLFFFPFFSCSKTHNKYIQIYIYLCIYRETILLPRKTDYENVRPIEKKKRKMWCDSVPDLRFTTCFHKFFFLRLFVALRLITIRK